jgi:hypothetical protein
MTNPFAVRASRRVVMSVGVVADMFVVVGDGCRRYEQY